jgi:Phosphoesterase family
MADSSYSWPFPRTSYTSKGFVDHTIYDTTSILRFIEWRYGLQPLTSLDAAANNLLVAFDFGQAATAAGLQALPDSVGASVLWLALLSGFTGVVSASVSLWRRGVLRS